MHVCVFGCVAFIPDRAAVDGSVLDSEVSAFAPISSLEIESASASFVCSSRKIRKALLERFHRCQNLHVWYRMTLARFVHPCIFGTTAARKSIFVKKESEKTTGAPVYGS